MLIDYKIIDDSYYIAVKYCYIEWLDELLFRKKQPFYNKSIQKNMYDTFNKCNIEEFEGYLYHVHDKKIMFLGTFEKQDKTNPHSFSWKINEYFDCDKFWKENASFYENYYKQQNIFFYFKLKNKKDFVKFKLLYKEN